MQLSEVFTKSLSPPINGPLSGKIALIMPLIGAETIVVEHQVVVVTSCELAGGNIACSYEVHHPLDGKTYRYAITLPKDVSPQSKVWDELEPVFAGLFPRREYMLVYRDSAKAFLLEAAYKLVKVPPPEKAAPPKETAQ